MKGVLDKPGHILSSRSPYSTHCYRERGGMVAFLTLPARGRWRRGDCGIDQHNLENTGRSKCKQMCGQGFTYHKSDIIPFLSFIKCNLYLMMLGLGLPLKLICVNFLSISSKFIMPHRGDWKTVWHNRPTKAALTHLSYALCGVEAIGQVKIPSAFPCYRE